MYASLCIVNNTYKFAAFVVAANRLIACCCDLILLIFCCKFVAVFAAVRSLLRSACWFVANAIMLCSCGCVQFVDNVNLLIIIPANLLHLLLLLIFQLPVVVSYYY